MLLLVFLLVNDIADQRSGKNQSQKVQNRPTCTARPKDQLSVIADEQVGQSVGRPLNVRGLIDKFGNRVIQIGFDHMTVLDLYDNRVHQKTKRKHSNENH